MSWGSLPSTDLPLLSLGSNSKLIFAKILMEVRTIYLASHLFLPNSPRSSLQPNRTNRINKRMTALLNAKRTLSIAIDMITKPYANATATTQETVSRVSSLNLSSINNDGELLVSSCSGGICNKHLPSSFPLVVPQRMHGKRRTGQE